MRDTDRQRILGLHARFCAALGDRTRLLILYELRGGALTVGQLADALGTTQPLTSRHLGILREKGLVRAAREGSFVLYSISDRRILTAIDTLLAVLTSQLRREAASATWPRRVTRRASA